MGLVRNREDASLGATVAGAGIAAEPVAGQAQLRKLEERACAERPAVGPSSPSPVLRSSTRLRQRERTAIQQGVPRW